MATRLPIERLKDMADRSIVGATGMMAKRAHGDRSSRARMVILMLCVGLAFAVLFSLTAGASDASAVRVIRDWLVGTAPADAALSARDHLIVYDIRLPRVILGVLVGAALAVSGAVMQGLFRNPLADPGLIGVSAGASLGAVAVIVLGATLLAPLTALLGTLALPLAAFCGGLATTLVLYQVATRQRPYLRRHHAAGRHRAGRPCHGADRNPDLHG
jgi:iron complex transport system permease protein